jgi:hypothetical protein
MAKLSTRAIRNKLSIDIESPSASLYQKHSLDNMYAYDGCIPSFIRELFRSCCSTSIEQRWDSVIIVNSEGRGSSIPSEIQITQLIPNRSTNLISWGGGRKEKKGRNEISKKSANKETFLRLTTKDLCYLCTRSVHSSSGMIAVSIILAKTSRK